MFTSSAGEAKDSRRSGFPLSQFCRGSLHRGMEGERMDQESGPRRGSHKLECGPSDLGENLFTSSLPHFPTLNDGLDCITL